MKRNKLLKYLKLNHCVLLREGGKHSIFYNIKTGRTSTVPRHSEVNDFLVKKILKDLVVVEKGRKK